MEEIKRIKERQAENRDRAKRFSDSFILLNPSMGYMAYPLFWTAYGYFAGGGRMKGSRAETRAAERGIFYWKRPERCFFAWGSFSPDLIDELEKRFDATAVHVNLNRRGLNIFWGKRLSISVRGSLETPEYYMPEGFDEGLVSAASDFIDRKLGSVRAFMHSFGDALSRLSPIFMISDEDRTKYKRAAAEICSARKVKTAVLQHGLTPSTSGNGIPYANESFAPLYSDLFLAWGDSALAFMLENGVERERVSVCGRPGRAPLCTESSGRKRALLVIDQQFLSFDEEREIFYADVKKIAERVKGGTAVYMRGDYNKSFLMEAGLSGLCIDWRPGGIEREICSSRTVLSYASTALIEAAEMGVRPVSIDYMERGDIFSFKGRIESFTRWEDAAEAVQSERQSSGADIEYIVKFRGRESARRAAEAIGELLT